MTGLESGEWLVPYAIVSNIHLWYLSQKSATDIPESVSTVYGYGQSCSFPQGMVMAPRPSPITKGAGEE